MSNPENMADLLIENALLVATVDNARRELKGGWVAITNGLVSGVGSSLDPKPVAREKRRYRLSRDTWFGKYAPSHVSKSDACVSSNDRQAIVRLVAIALSVVARH